MPELDRLDAAAAKAAQDAMPPPKKKGFSLLRAKDKPKTNKKRDKVESMCFLL